MQSGLMEKKKKGPIIRLEKGGERRNFTTNYFLISRALPNTHTGPDQALLPTCAGFPNQTASACPGHSSDGHDLPVPIPHALPCPCFRHRDRDNGRSAYYASMEEVGPCCPRVPRREAGTNNALFLFVVWSSPSLLIRQTGRSPPLSPD